MHSSNLWRPFTQEKTASRSIKISRGDGAYVFDENGKKYLDLISSWWVNLHGHCNPEIAEAIHQQAKTLEHIIFAGFTHSPAEQLCEKLSSVLPKKLCKFFFSDNGSTAVEIALKMAYQRWKNIGIQGKNKFVSFIGGYHGDTFGAMSVSSGYHDMFSELFFGNYKISWPSTWIGDDFAEQKEQKSIEEYKSCLLKHKNEISAIIVEPMVQGAGGMRMIRSQFLQQICEISAENDITVIFDEVMTGFYRTGKMFALEYLKNYAPDILCLSKGITGGFLPLSVTIASQEIFDAFLDDSSKKALLHGHSYTANPLGCAAALASFDILERESTLRNIKNIETIHREETQKLLEFCSVSEVRTIGTISAFSIKNASAFAIKNVEQQMLEAGFIIRPLGKTFYFIPPYCITEKQLTAAYESLFELIRRESLTMNNVWTI